MTSSLLRTKINAPRPAPDCIPRPHLIYRLQEGVKAGKRLTLISAPAGYGKTSLVVQWLASLDRAVAWVSLDEADSDPATFMAYLLASLEGAGASIDELLHNTLAQPNLPPLVTLMVPLINQLNASSRELVLVLDDYHRLDSSEIHDAIALLLNRAPPTLHLAILTRHIPPLPLARLLANGTMQELGEGDLRFSIKESAEFLSTAVAGQLPINSVSALHSRTEGWAAGLRLAALSLQRSADPLAAIDDFGGSDRHVLDYLVEEVLSLEDPTVRDFLLRTSILDRFTPETCASLYGDEVDTTSVAEARQLLWHVEERQLFVIPLDTHRQWYRYHHLFAEALRSRLRVYRPDLEPKLHRRAAQWFEQEELIDEAIQHASCIGDDDVAALLERAGMLLVSRNQHRRLLSYLDRLPPERVAKSARLLLQRAYTLLALQCWQDAEELLSRIDQRAGHDNDSWMSACVAALRAYGAASAMHMQRVQEWARSAVEALSPDTGDNMNQMLVGLALFALGRHHYWVTADLYQAEGYLGRSMAIAEARGDGLMLGMTLSAMASVAKGRGDLRKAEAILRKGLALAQHRGGLPGDLPLSTDWLHHELANTLYDLSNISDAEKHQERALELCELARSTKRPYVCLHLAHLRQAQGRPDEALDLFSQSAVIAEHSVDGALFYQSESLHFDYVRRQYWPHRAKPLAEVAELVASVLGAHTESFVANVVRTKGIGYGLLSLHRYEEAVQHLSPQSQACLSRGLYGGAVVPLSQLAVAKAELGRDDEALDHLRQRLDLAQRLGHLRDIFEGGPRMQALLRQALSRGIYPGYIRRLLTELPWLEPEGGTQPGPQLDSEGLVLEPLTEREREVLRLWALRLSAPEIAEQLTLSYHTVRSYVRTIYEKLGVHTREEATERAEDIGLI